MAAITTLPEITVQELQQRLAAGAALVDVREVDEYEQGHVPGARLIPLGELPGRVAEVPAGEQVLMICRSGARSANAGEFLIGEGRDVVNVAGGTLAWIEAGFEVNTGNQP